MTNVNTRTFSKVIRKYILWCLGLTLLFYTIILNSYLRNGTLIAASFELETTGQQYERALTLNPNTPFPHFLNIMTYEAYEDIPNRIRKHYPQDEIKAGDLFLIDLKDLEGKITHGDMRLDLFHMIFPYKLKDGRLLFFVKSFDSEDKDSVLFEKMNKFSLITLPIAGGVIVFFLIIVWVLGKSIANPSQDLALWAKNLSSANLHQPIPDFKFVELNGVAKELHSSFVRVDEFVLRERDFLRQASHELRTPVTVISGNIELLAKHDLSDVQTRVVDRINRASKNMKQLIETLLWLGREIDPEMIKKDIDYKMLLEEVMEELSYLSESEYVESQVTVLNTGIVSASSVALYIVVSNLMRNAFQHTPKGHVDIRLIDDVLSVENHLDVQSSKRSEKLGKGVGLNLVQRICNRCGWHCEIQPLDHGGMRAILYLDKNRKIH